MGEYKGIEPENWLVKIIYSAYEARWCVKPNCTTCGASEYRSAVVRGALEQAGEDTSRYTASPSERLVRPMLRNISPSRKTKVIKEVSYALRDVEDVQDIWDGLAVILMDLDAQYVIDASDQTLDDILEGTVVGEMLTSMRTHYAKRVAKRRLREETEQQNRKENYEQSLYVYLRGCAVAEAKGNPWPPIPNRVAKAIMFKTEEELQTFVTSQKTFKDYLADLQDLPLFHPPPP